ncbi:hypothetical protein [Bacillus smithii]
MKTYKKDNVVIRAAEGSALESQLIADGYKLVEEAEQEQQQGQSKKASGK